MSKAEAIFQRENFRAGPFHMHRKYKESKNHSFSSVMQSCKKNSSRKITFKDCFDKSLTKLVTIYFN